MTSTIPVSTAQRCEHGIQSGVTLASGTAGTHSEHLSDSLRQLSSPEWLLQATKAAVLIQMTAGHQEYPACRLTGKSPIRHFQAADIA
jgi:hypothetical protein